MKQKLNIYVILSPGLLVIRRTEKSAVTVKSRVFGC